MTKKKQNSLIATIVGLLTSVATAIVVIDFNTFDFYARPIFNKVPTRCVWSKSISKVFEGWVPYKSETNKEPRFCVPQKVNLYGINYESVWTRDPKCVYHYEATSKSLIHNEEKYDICSTEQIMRPTVLIHHNADKTIELSTLQLRFRDTTFIAPVPKHLTALSKHYGFQMGSYWTVYDSVIDTKHRQVSINYE